MIRQTIAFSRQVTTHHGSSRRRGISLVWTALMLTMFLGMAGLAIDTGYAWLAAQQLQNAGDAAALAGAQMLSVDPSGIESLQQAKAIAQANKVVSPKPKEVPGPIPVKLDETNPHKHYRRNNDNEVVFDAVIDDMEIKGDVVIGRWDSQNSQFIVTPDRPNAVLVYTHHTADVGDGALQLLFGPIFNVSTVNIERWAIAMMHGGAAYYALDETGTGLKVWGDAALHSNGGGGVVNSNDGKAIVSKPNAIDSPWIESPGQASGYGGDLIDGSETDPLAGLPMPGSERGINSVADLETRLLAQYPPGPTVPVSGVVDVSMRKLENYYYFPNGLNGNLSLAPGIYIIEKGVSGALTGTGVMLFVNSGSIDLHGNTQIDLQPPARRLSTGEDPYPNNFPLADTYWGITIWQPESNSSTASFHGTADARFSVDGTIYMPTATLQAFGTITNMGNRLIVGSIDITGHVTIGIDYDPSARGAPKYQSYLVN